MDIIRDIHSLTDFRRNPRELLKNVKEKHAVVLTVRGKPAAVIQDAESYQRLVDIAQEKSMPDVFTDDCPHF